MTIATINIIWHRSAIDWLTSIRAANKGLISSSKVPSIQAALTTPLQSLGISSDELDSTSIVQFVLTNEGTPAGELFSVLQKKPSSKKKAAAAAAAAASGKHPQPGTKAAATFFLRRFLKRLCVSVLGQRVSWTAAVGLAKFIDAPLTIEINEDIDDDDDDDNDIAEEELARIKILKKKKALLSLQQQQKKASTTTKTTGKPQAKKKGGKRRQRGGNDDDDDDEDGDNSSSSSSGSSSSDSDDDDSDLSPEDAIPGVDEIPHWSMNSFLASQQHYSASGINSNLGLSTATQQRSPYLAVAPKSFVDELIEEQQRHNIIHQQGNNNNISNNETDEVFTFPIVVGSVSKWLGPQAERMKSRLWTLYVRGPNFEDLSSVIEKVVFHLHETFENPHRAVESPPFEIHEYGWGQFVAFAEIFFRVNSSESPSSPASQHPPVRVIVNHFIRFDPGPPRSGVPLVADNKQHCVPPLGKPYVTDAECFMPQVVDGSTVPSVWEEYDEIVIVRPPPVLRQALVRFAETRGGSVVPKSRNISVKKDIEANGVPLAKLVDDTAEMAALTKIQTALENLVEQRMRPKMQALGGSLMATSAAATKLGGARAWNHFRRLAGSVNESLESASYAPL